MNEPKLKIYKDSDEVVSALATDFAHFAEQKSKSKEPGFVALSGGSTPQQLFSYLADHYHDKIDWNSLHFFWVDERCVPPTDAESNYGVAKKLLFDRINIPENHIHRMRGEEDPAQEAQRYGEEILSHVPSRLNLPQFDWALLGMGDDGHTASIFPDQLSLMHSDAICETAVHPVSKQRRITLTGRVINHARRVSFLVTGKGKAEMTEIILRKPGVNNKYPAFHIRPAGGNLEWYLDKDAAALL